MPVPRLLRPLSAAVVVLATGAVGTQSASAACPGALPAGTCAYTASSQIGERTGGVLRFPQAVSVAADGAVYVADQKTHAITVFNPDGSFRRDYGFAGSKPGQLTSVGGVAVAGDGSVFVTTGANRVDRFAPDGSLMLSWGKTGQEVGQFVFGSGGGNDSPAGGGVAVTGDTVYVADSRNDRIQRFALDGSGGSVMVPPGILQTPMGVAVRKTRVFVADDENHRIAVFDTGGRSLGFIGEGEGSTGGQLKNPYDVALDAQGRVFVADDLNHRIVRYGPLPDYSYKARWGAYGTAPGRQAFPRGIATDAAGLIYVTNTGNDRIDVYDNSGRLLRSMGRSGRASGQWDTPTGVAVDPSGVRAVADSVNGRVQFLGPDGAIVSIIGSPNPGPTILGDPVATAFDGNGNAYVLDQRGGKIVVFSRQNGRPFRTIGSEGTGKGKLLNPSAIAISPGGTIYVADTGNQRISRFTSTGTALSDFPSATQGKSPRGLAITPDGSRIYVATASDNRIRAYDQQGRLQVEFGGIGNKIGKLVSPAQISLDPAGNVWVADRGNSRVQKFGRDGERLAAFGARGTGPGEFLRPESVAVDCRGTVTVSDTDNNRVQQFTLAEPPSGTCDTALPPFAVPPTPKYPVLPAPDGPVMKIKVLRRSSLLGTRNLPLRVRCDTACTVTASATVTPHAAPIRPKKPKKGKRPPTPKRVFVTLKSAPKTITAAGTAQLRLALGAADAAKLRKALGPYRAIDAEVQLTASGDAGDPTSQVLKLRLTR
ncbi:Virginiamycin B lyase [Paraconexibacter sp. AEG42_29]|uniref:Virginiamycin B lyase n=1 Tax=Paraconexibacter sp. AEG42_29 TaxID=2997339 RepID=A0AAU7AZN7_9ACTN